MSMGIFRELFKGKGEGTADPLLAVVDLAVIGVPADGEAELLIPPLDMDGNVVHPGDTVMVAHTDRSFDVAAILLDRDEWSVMEETGVTFLGSPVSKGHRPADLAVCGRGAAAARGAGDGDGQKG